MSSRKATRGVLAAKARTSQKGLLQQTGQDMNFASDNWAGAHPRISAALNAAAAGFDPAYGTGGFDARVAETFNRVFEREVAVFFVATGTAANALSLASVAKPGGIAFCHREAHMIEDECGAPEYLSGGGRLYPVDGSLGRMEPARLARAIARFPEQFVHAGRPVAVSVTQATEVGTVYSLVDLDQIGLIARRNSLTLHMDGARFANALAALDATPAEMTWKRGVDILSFGGTKNGCWCAEAVVLFDLDRAEDFAFLRKRAAQLFSKSRFVASQFAAYFEDDLWLETARHSNAMARRLAGAIEGSRQARLAWTPQANEVFALLPRAIAEAAKAKGAVFHDWHLPAGFGDADPDRELLCRFVTSFATTAEDVDRFADLIT